MIKKEPSHSELLSWFIENSRLLCKSILLVGSHASDEVLDSSDIDLLIVTDNEKEIHTIVGSVDEKVASDRRPTLDCKILPEVTIKKKINGPDNFYYWTCSKNYRVLHGFDFLNQVKLHRQNVVELLWSNENKLREALDWIEQKIRFSGSCCYVYEALSTAYFVERYVTHSLSSVNRRKDGYLHFVLQNQFQKIRKRYYMILRKSRVWDGPISIKIASEYDRGVKPIEYEYLSEKAEKIHSLNRKLRIDVQSWVDSHN